VIRRDDGTLEIGRTLPGRGAWVCAGTDGAIEPGCLQQAERRKAFPRALRGDLADGALSALRARMEQGHEDGRA
jgi:predicted RNA-binding protein YlxR (DUF448 family)